MTIPIGLAIIGTVTGALLGFLCGLMAAAGRNSGEEEIQSLRADIRSLEQDYKADLTSANHRAGEWKKLFQREHALLAAEQHCPERCDGIADDEHVIEQPAADDFRWTYPERLGQEAGA